MEHGFKLRLVCSEETREWYLRLKRKRLIKIIPIKLTEQERKEKRKRIIEALLRNG